MANVSTSNQVSLNSQQSMTVKEPSMKFKDSIEVKLQAINGIAHSVSKGSYLVRESEFIGIFKKAKINLLSQDIELLQAFFRANASRNSSINFNSFIDHFNISRITSDVLMELQKEVAIKKVKIEDALSIYPKLSFDDFYQFLIQNKLNLAVFTDEYQRKFFQQICERREEIEKNALIRIIRNQDEDDQREWLPFIVNELVYYIFNNNINLFKVVNPSTKKLSQSDFNQLLTAIKYIPSLPKDMPTLLTYLAPENDSTNISIEKLVQCIRKFNPSYGSTQNASLPQKQGADQKQQAATQKVIQQLSQFTPKVKDILSKVNDQLKRNGKTVQEIYIDMDENKNGMIEKVEFMNYFSSKVTIKGAMAEDLELLFDAIDTNKNGYLSINEVCLCLEGAQRAQDQKLKGIDLELEKQLLEEITKLFEVFDKDNDGTISLQELQLGLKAVKQGITLKEAEEVMKAADKNGNGLIEKQEFIAVLLPKFKQEIISNEDNLDDLRRLFKESDTDNNHYLSKDELIKILIKLGVELTTVQVEDLMREMDRDENGQIDIDEFVAFLSIADQIQLKNPQSKQIVMNIRRARKLQPIDFFNCFRNLPSFFCPSFTQDQFERRNKFTPSHFITPAFNSKTLTYMDLLKLSDISNIPIKKYISNFQPNFACEISLEEAISVPQPKIEKEEWPKIEQREIRAMLFDFRTHEFLSNSFILAAVVKQGLEDKWLFSVDSNQNQAKNFIIRTDLLADKSQIRDIHLLFELVITISYGPQTTSQQITCAWGSTSILNLDKASKQKIILKGGNPLHEMNIEQSELQQNKKGFSFLKKLSKDTDEPQLVINIKPWLKLQENTQYYISMLPSTCLVPKRLISFVSGFRLYCHKKLNKYQQQLVEPQGNFVIAQFSKIFNNPDVNLLLGDCWDIEVTQKQVQSINLENILIKLEEFVTKLYPIIYNSNFRFDHIFPTRSTPIESDLFQQREVLIKSSLLIGKFKTIKEIQKKKDASREPLQEIPYEYKPFNINEMEIKMQGLDIIENKQEDLLKMYQQMGLLS